VKIDSGDIAPIIGALGALLTVLGGIATNIWMMVRQNRKIESNHAELKGEISDFRAATGSFKTLPPPDAT